MGAVRVGGVVGAAPHALAGNVGLWVGRGGVIVSERITVLWCVRSFVGSRVLGDSGIRELRISATD